jgi:beta-phosphoglucomutase
MPVGYRGDIFDVDGVLVDSPHERAWRETLRLLMEIDWRDVQPQTTYTPERFAPAVYQEVVAGKPRMSGARAALDDVDLDALAEGRLERRSR